MQNNTSRWHPDVTVAAVCARDGQFLLVKERSKTTGNMVYNQPAGHLDPNESIIEAAIREVKEETCRHFTPRGFVGFYRLAVSAEKTYLRYTFWGDVSAVDPSLQLDPDIDSTHWLSLPEIEQNTQLRSPVVLTCVNDYLTGPLYPLDVIKDTPATSS